MKFKISKAKFLEGLQQVQHAVSSRATLPILSNVLIEADLHEIRFTTTDLDVVVSARISSEDDMGIKIIEPGAITLPARRLVGIVRELPASEVEVTSGNRLPIDDLNDDPHANATIKCGNSFFKILGLPSDDFPPPPRFEEVKEYKITQKTLRDALKKTAYAISTDETRYILNGIYFQFKEGKMSLVATDGRRLAMMDVDVEFPESHETSVIVPTKAVNELQRLLADDATELRIRIGARQIAFEFNQNLLVSKLIEGRYPDFRQVIPGAAKERVTLEREAFLEAAQRVSLLSPDNSNSVKLHFSKDNIEITANSLAIGEARESIAVKYSGPEMAIAFNSEYLLDPLRNLDVDEIYLDLIDETSAAVIKLWTPFLYVVMPIRLTS